MAIAMDSFSMSQLGALRWASARRRVRASVGGEVVVDSEEARIVWEPHRVVGSYAVPRAALATAPIEPAAVASLAAAPVGRPLILTPDDPFALHTSRGTVWTIPTAHGALAGAAFEPDDPELAGWLLLDWRAFDEWREEEAVVLAHPHDPFQRIDCLPSSRDVVVVIGGVEVARSTRSVLLLETHLPPRHYLPTEDVRMDLLAPSDTVSECAYKGRAAYWSFAGGDRPVADVAWTYPDPLHDGEPVRGMVCFWDERVDVTVDGVSTRQPSPFA